MDEHPACAAFPLMAGADFDDLVADIAAHGLREPIVLDATGRVLDGRNRLRACVAAGVQPRTRPYDGPEGGEVEWVVSMNVHRRHLTVSQRAMVATKLLPHFQAEARERMAQGGRGGLEGSPNLGGVEGKATEKAAEHLKVGRGSVESAAKVLRQGVPELTEAVEAGTLAVSRAAKIADLPPDKQRKALADPVAHVAHNSGNDEWGTPPAFIEAARECMGRIDTDPASNLVANETVRAATYYTSREDGLKQQWSGMVWLNPPYSQPLIARFASAVVEKYTSGEIDAACVLVNNATETAWFRRMITEASMVCFTAGRVRFLDFEGNPAGAPLQGQAVIYMGPDPERFREAFAGLGWMARP